MKKVSKEEAQKMLIKKGPSKLFRMCASIKVGEGIFVDRDVYKNKSDMAQYIGSSQNGEKGYLKKMKVRMSVNTLREGGGWLLTRIK